MDLEGIMLSEVTQKKIDKNYMISLTGGTKTNKLIEKQIRFVVTRGWGWEVRELGECGQKVQTSNKYWGYNVQYDDYS